MSTREYHSHSHRRYHKRQKSYALKVFVITLFVVLLMGLFTAYMASEQNPQPSESQSIPQTTSVSQAVPSQAPLQKAVSMPKETPSSQSEKEQSGAAPKIDKEQWNLILVNPWNPIPENHSIALTELKNDQAVDERCYPALQDMMDACRAEGLSPVICSSYRSMEKQKKLFKKQIDTMLAMGLSQAEAEQEAAKAVAIPGTSEHQLGLAVDIVDLNNQSLDESQEETGVQKWLLAHCWEYGFILRYPNDKSEITGIMYEPWHYRYVGKEIAMEIYRKGECLEEYLKRN
jgi:D-alanyl-D-alanine carboxypeptidase